MVHDYKYNNKRDLAIILAKILDRVLPAKLKGVSVIPLPTIDKHIRVRGFDHCLLLAQEFSKIRKYKIERLLIRKNDSIQVGADREKRKAQAANAYGFNGKIDSCKGYLLLDDVFTSGSSMNNAERILRKNGAKNIYKVVLAKES